MSLIEVKAKSWWVVLALVAAGSAAIGASCSAGVSGSGGSGGGSSGTPSGSAASTTGAFMNTGGGSSCAGHCTADLHSYIDCNNNVVKTCPDDQGCAPDGSCVAPCDAAKQNQSTVGCDFFTPTPAVIFGARGGCFTAMVANTWTSPVALSLEYGGMTIDASQFTFVASGQQGTLQYTPMTNGALQPGELGIVMLSQYASGDIYHVDCPKPAAVNVQTQLDGTGKGSAFHLTASAPVIAYDVYPWGGATSFATSSTLLLPTPSWGTNVVTADGWSAENGNPLTQVVAAEDATTVTFVPKMAVIPGGGVPAMPANVPATFVLNKGEYVQFLQPDRLAGSTLQSDKPVGVWGGASCMNIPTGMQACDTGHQELLPVTTLGSDYIAARYPSRGGDDSAPFTFVGTVDGTTLTYDPPIPGAPATLARGELEFFSTDVAFTVKSQGADHPFYVAAHMTGGGTNPDGLGDPDYVNVVPPLQYLSHYLFVTDPTYKDTSLVFTRRKDKTGVFQDVKLDCFGTLTDWQNVDSAGNDQVSRIKMVVNGAGVAGCNNGVHTADSPGPFGLTVWGYDSYASYAYPAGMSVQPINTVVVPPIPQ